MTSLDYGEHKTETRQLVCLPSSAVPYDKKPSGIHVSRT